MRFTTTISELPVTLDVTKYHPGSPGSFNPRDGGSPPEYPEAEFRVLLMPPDGAGTDAHPLDITDYLADDIIEGLHETAIDEVEAADAEADLP